MVNFVETEIIKENIHLAKTLEVKNGIDYYLADNDFAKSLGKHLQQRFGGVLTISATLYSRRDGRDINRLTILFRALMFKKGDTVHFKGENYESNR